MKEFSGWLPTAKLALAISEEGLLEYYGEVEAAGQSLVFQINHLNIRKSAAE